MLFKIFDCLQTIRRLPVRNVLQFQPPNSVEQYEQKIVLRDEKNSQHTPKHWVVLDTQDSELGGFFIPWFWVRYRVIYMINYIRQRRL